jgi:hypothetical protein
VAPARREVAFAAVLARKPPPRLEFDAARTARLMCSELPGVDIADGQPSTRGGREKVRPTPPNYRVDPASRVSKRHSGRRESLRTTSPPASKVPPPATSRTTSRPVNGKELDEAAVPVASVPVASVVPSTVSVGAVVASVVVGLTLCVFVVQLLYA